MKIVKGFGMGAGCNNCNKPKREVIELCSNDVDGAVWLCLPCLNKAVMMLLEHMRKKEDEYAKGKD